jgi:hypothetical protein
MVTAPPATSVPVRDLVFFSYSRADEKWLKLLQKTLKPALKGNAVKTWADTDLDPGQKWRAEIAKALAAARVAVLLVSADFLASDFIDKHELPPLLDAAERHGVAILWVYVRPCMYKASPIADYEAAHDIASSLYELPGPKRELQLVRIADEIVTAYNGRTPADLFVAAAADQIVEGDTAS